MFTMSLRLLKTTLVATVMQPLYDPKCIKHIHGGELFSLDSYLQENACTLDIQHMHDETNILPLYILIKANNVHIFICIVHKFRCHILLYSRVPRFRRLKGSFVKSENYQLSRLSLNIFIH